MTELCVLTSQMEARMVADLLISHGIHAEIVGAKDYVGHLTGAETGNYKIFVAVEALTQALEVLRDIEKS